MFGALWIAVLASGFVFLGRPVWGKLAGLKDQHAMATAAVQAKSEEIRSYKSKQQRFQTDPDFVELLARQNKRVRPNEVLYKFEARAD